MPKRNTKTKPPEPSEQNELDAAIASLDSGNVDLPTVDSALARLDRKNPLDAVPETDDSEKDCKAVVSATLAAFKNAAKNETKTFQDNTDSEYWFCVCFQSREQKDAFLKAVDWFKHGDKYLDGQWVSKKLGIELPKAERTFNTGEVNKSMAAMGIIDGMENPKKKRRKG